ncbi:MAG: Alpha-ribazole phosphatase [Lacticaseibacillus casei]
MATIDLVRHAEPDITIHDDFLRPLTSAGQRQTQQLVDSLHQYPYTAFFQAHSNVLLIRSHRLQMITAYPFKKTNYWWSEKCLHGCQIFLTMLISSGKI